MAAVAGTVVRRARWVMGVHASVYISCDIMSLCVSWCVDTVDSRTWANLCVQTCIDFGVA